jgi:hypothetical protein
LALRCGGPLTRHATPSRIPWMGSRPPKQACSRSQPEPTGGKVCSRSQPEPAHKDESYRLRSAMDVTKSSCSQVISAARQVEVKSVTIWMGITRWIGVARWMGITRWIGVARWMGITSNMQVEMNRSRCELRYSRHQFHHSPYPAAVARSISSHMEVMTFNLSSLDLCLVGRFSNT